MFFTLSLDKNFYFVPTSCDVVTESFGLGGNVTYTFSANERPTADSKKALFVLVAHHAVGNGFAGCFNGSLIVLPEELF